MLSICYLYVIYMLSIYVIYMSSICVYHENPENIQNNKDMGQHPKLISKAIVDADFEISTD